MERISTAFNGITSSPTYEEGDCLSLVNLRPKNGTLIPVTSRKIKYQLTQKYDIVFIHANQGYENWIGVKNDQSTSSLYWKIETANPTLIATITGNVNSLQQIGNTLSFITSDSMFYAFFKNIYSFLGELPDLPPIMFGADSVMHYGKFSFSEEYGEDAVTPNNFIDCIKGLVNKGMSKIVNGYTDDEGNPKPSQGPMLFDAHFVRYAFRLYDGTLIKHSPPILILPSRPICGKEEELGEGNTGDSIKTISYDFDSVLNNKSKIEIYGYRSSLTYDSAFKDWSKWTDIIKSVDIFMSTPLGISNIDNVRKDMPVTDSARLLNYNLIKGLSEDAIDNIKNTSNFYFFKSIPIGISFAMETIPSTKEDGSKIENLIHQELMSDDNSTNHRLGSEISFCYNSRIHLSNIKTTFFNGFNPDFFMFIGTKTSTSSLFGGNYNGVTYNDISSPIFNKLLMEVEINTGTSTEKVYKEVYHDMNNNFYKLFMTAYISYPDSRATRFTIYRYSSSSWYKVFSGNFQKHNFLNLAYFISDGLKPITETSATYVSSINTSTVVSLQEPNKIKVSDLNNPMRFPNKNTYQIGNGKILALATNAMNVADWNYGQYPLYVFTSQGIWTMSVGEGEVAYSVLSTPTYQEAPVNGVVCPTPYGVVFIAPKGLMLINGQSVEFLSSQLKQTALPLSIEIPEEVKSLIHLPDDLSFEEYLNRVDSIAYNPHESEIIISDRAHKYDYVYNTLSQQYFMSTEKFNQVVKNYPSGLLVVDQGNRIRDYLESGDIAASVSFILRPLTFGTNEIKGLERMILRGNFYNGDLPSATELVLMIHHSNDNNFFKLTRGMKKGPADYRDIDLGLFARSKWRQFVVSFGGVIEGKSQIFNVDTMIEKEYTNTKMR